MEAMTMRSILPASDAVLQDLIEAHDRLGRLAALEPEHKEMALQFLCGFSPAVFDVILKATEPIGGYSIADDDAEPFCLTCRHPIGVFPATNGVWRHYRGDGITTRPEPYETDHRPALGWRTPVGTTAC
jgi:hypothetical protein